MPRSRSAGRGSRSHGRGVHRPAPINHVVLVNFGEFKELIDALGGIDIVVPRRIQSKFDCPYGTEARCARWPGWRFRPASST